MTWLRTTIAVPVDSRPIKGHSLVTTLEYQEICLALNLGPCDTWLVLAVSATLSPELFATSLLPGKDLRLEPCSSVEASKVLLDIPEQATDARYNLGCKVL